MHNYIGLLLYRAYIDRHPSVKHSLKECGQAHLGLALNLNRQSSIVSLIIQFLEPEYIIYLVLNDNYNIRKDHLFTHIIHLNNMIKELSGHLYCRFCSKAPTGGVGCPHYKLDVNLGHINCSPHAKTIIKRYYPSGSAGSWLVDWDLYITIGNRIQDDWRSASWLVQNNINNERCDGELIKNYFHSYYYWWSGDDYDIFIKTCSKIID